MAYDTSSNVTSITDPESNTVSLTYPSTHSYAYPNLPPLHKVPIPVYRTTPHDFSSGFTTLWRSFGPFSTSEYFSVQPDNEEYSPGDTLTGTIHFSNQFKDATLSIYLVFVKKEIALWKPGEREHLILHRKDIFQAGLTIPFSLTLPPVTYPDFETEHSKIYWKLRAIVSSPFHIGKVAECDIKVKPLLY